MQNEDEEVATSSEIAMKIKEVRVHLSNIIKNPQDLFLVMGFIN